MPLHQFLPTITQSANLLWEVMCTADVKTQICMASTYLETQWPRKSFSCLFQRATNALCPTASCIIAFVLASRKGAVVRWECLPPYTGVAWVPIVWTRLSLLMVLSLLQALFFGFSGFRSYSRNNTAISNSKQQRIKRLSLGCMYHSQFQFI